MLQNTEANGRLKGIKTCRTTPSISHLLFADDSLLLLEANANSAHELNQILNVYEGCSDQAINKKKSTILFSKNTKREDKEELMNQLNIATEGFSGKYLGLPCYIGKSKSKAFEYIKERVWKRYKGAKKNALEGRQGNSYQSCSTSNPCLCNGMF